MTFWKVKSPVLAATSYREVLKKVRSIFKLLKSTTKRKPYVRSHYFKKRKVFLDYFWEHLFQKPEKQRLQRLKLFAAGLELIQQSQLQPEVKVNPNKMNERLYRFYGITHSISFVVQIKEGTKSLQLISIFPWK